jgi:DNA-binding GntR family transcriptional regulator
MARANRRTADKGPPPGKGATAARLYAALKHEILELILPPSAPIEEVRLGERFGCSRTPIREALTRLAAEGLVELRTNRSAIVAPITAQSMVAYFEALAYVSTAVARLAATRRTDAQLATIRRCQERFGSLLREKREFDRGDRNRDFPMAVGAAANNRFLAEQYGVLLDRGVRLANIPFYSEEDEGEDVNAHFRQASDDHDEIIRAIAKRDAVRVESITLAHVELFRHRIAKFLSQYGSSLIEGHLGEHRLPKLRHAPALPAGRGASLRSRAEAEP